MSRKGKRLERLVQMIESAIADDDAVTVHSPYYLVDKDGGRKREHDVVLVVKHAHHEIYVAIECRDRSRPVGVPEIEAFSAKCSRTGVHCGIIVSSSGFARTALEKSASFGIQCIEFAEAAQFDWFQAPGLQAYVRHMDQVTISVLVEGNLDENFQLWEKETKKEKGPTKITPPIINAIGLNVLNRLSPDSILSEPIDKSITAKFIDRKPNFYVTDSNDNVVEIKELQISVTYHIEFKLVPFEFRTYRQVEDAGVEYSLATADLEISGLGGRMGVIRHPERGVKLVWHPKKGDKD